MLLAILPGTRCYSDVSIDPDQNLHLPRIAGLGVFITNNQTQPTQSIYIQGRISNAISVLMAEAAALALAAVVASLLNLRPPNEQIRFLNMHKRALMPQQTKVLCALHSESERTKFA